MRRKSEKRMRGGLCVSGDVICEPTASGLMGAAIPYRPYRRTASSVLSIPLNTEPDEICCRTIKAQYYKNSLANFIRTDSFGAGGGLSSVQVGQISSPHSQCGTVYHPGGIAPTICACTHGYAIYHILEAHDELDYGRKQF